MNATSSNVLWRNQWVDHIPVAWAEPAEIRKGRRRLILFLPHFSGSKDRARPILEELAEKGFFAVSFDPWQHGERGTESPDDLFKRVFGQFRRLFWPILGQTTIDALRVIDWAIDTLEVETAVRVAGLSMGGDVAVALAGIDVRVSKVAAVVATPDWLRPGMRDLFKPEVVFNQGEADSQAQYFYDQLNPLTHLDRYRRALKIKFFSGEKDQHVPVDGPLRFQSALRADDGSPGARVEVQVLPGLTHLDTRDPNRWWPASRDWLIAE